MGIMINVIVSVCALGCAALQPQEPAKEEKRRNLEQRTWPAVSNGLVFVEGEFVPPPYVVSRVRNAIYINGQHVGTPGGWPTVNKQDVAMPTPTPENPTIPSEITQKTTMYDDIYIRYIYKKRRYLFATYGQEKGIDMMVDVYKSLFCIQDAKRAIDSNSIIVTWMSGDLDRVCQVPPRRAPNTGTPEQVAKMFDGICEIYYSGLEFNDYFMFGNVTRMGTQDGYGQFLAPIADALKTARDEEAFVSVMTNKFPMSTGFSAKAFRSFYQHKDKLPQWEPLLQKRCRGRQ